ncbi:MAG: VanZ family protein [Pseudomonadota bacterium]
MASPDFYALRLAPMWWVGGALLIAVVVYLSLAPGGPPVPVTLSDKLQHLLAYATLAIYFGGLVKRRAYWVVVLGLFGLSVLLECLQGWSGERTFDVVDMVFNGLGLAVGKRLSRVGLNGWCRWLERRLPS